MDDDLVSFLTEPLESRVLVDAHGHLRIAEVNIGEILKTQVARRLTDCGLTATLVAKNIGYEL